MQIFLQAKAEESLAGTVERSTVEPGIDLMSMSNLQPDSNALQGLDYFSF